MPKSTTLTKSRSSPRRSTWMFAGLRSRCTMPSACASASDVHTARAIVATRFHGIAPPAR